MTVRLNIQDDIHADNRMKAATMVATLVSLTLPAFAQRGQGGAQFLQSRDISRNGHGAGQRGQGQIIHDAMTVQLYDMSADEAISRPEFAQSSMRAFDMRDANGDGKIDIADFR